MPVSKQLFDGLIANFSRTQALNFVCMFAHSCDLSMKNETASWICARYRPQLTIATATVFCHRFYARHSHAPPENNRYVSFRKALFKTSTYLIARVSAGRRNSLSLFSRKSWRNPEVAERSRQGFISCTAQERLRVCSQANSSTGRNTIQLLLQMTFLLITPQDCFERQREHVLNAERLLLHALRFDFNVDHPYKHILSLAKRAFEELQFTQNFSRNLTQVAWNFANDRCNSFVWELFICSAILIPAFFPAASEQPCACSSLPEL